MKSRIALLTIAILLVTDSCKYFTKEPEENPIARVHDLYLYPSDLKEHMPKGFAGEDSIRILRRIVDEWIRDKLLLRKAEQYLAGSDYTIEKQLENYRASLLTYKFKQEYVLQRLDTLVSDVEINEYYTQNSSNYILNSDVVRLTYVKLNTKAPQLSMVRTLYKSERDEDLARLEQYCISYAENYIIKGMTWYKFSEFIQQTPLKIENPGRYLTYNRNIETSDSLFHYFIHIFELIPEKKTAPVEMVEKDIRNVLINKRRVTLIQELENQVYKEGISRNMAEIYK